MSIKRTKPLDDLEMFDLLQAAYPEKFPNEDDDTFEAVHRDSQGESESTVGLLTTLDPDNCPYARITYPPGPASHNSKATRSPEQT